MSTPRSSTGSPRSSTGSPRSSTGSPRSSTGSVVRSALFEALFVVLGVVLALGANEWRQARNDRALAEQALQSIREEMALNRAAVQEAVAYHGFLIDTLRTLVQRQAPPPSARLFYRGFVDPAPVIATAWTTATNTDAVSHMAYEDVLVVSRVYDEQEAYEVQGRAAGDVIYEQLYARGTDGIAENYRNLLSVIYTFQYREAQLVAVYDSALAVLGVPEIRPGEAVVAETAE